MAPAAVEVRIPEKVGVPAKVPPSVPPATALSAPPTVVEEVTVRRVVLAEIVEISEKREVEEAKIPLVALRIEEVAAVTEPKLVLQVKSKAPDGVAKSRPGTALTMTPLLSVLRTEEGTWKSVVLPMLEIANSVEVEKTPPELVEEEREKSMGLVEDAVASSVSAAKGLEVPSPKLPVEETKVN